MPLSFPGTRRLLFGDGSIYGPELLPNGGFETITTVGPPINYASWTEAQGDGALVDEGTLVHSGSHAVKMTAGATGNTTILVPMTVVPGQRCVVTFWTRGDGTYGGRYKLYDLTQSANITVTLPTGVTGTTYALVTVPVTIPAGCISMGLYLNCPSTAGGIAYFDDTSCKRRLDIP